MNNKLILIFVCTLIGSSCDRTYTYINRQKDKEASQKIADQFYTYLSRQQPKEAMSILSRGGNSIDGPKIEKIFSIAAAELGIIEKIQLDSCNTKVVEGSRSSGEYFLYYTVIHEKYKTNDVFKLKLENNKIYINDFRMNPSMK